MRGAFVTSHGLLDAFVGCKVDRMRWTCFNPQHKLSKWILMTICVPAPKKTEDIPLQSAGIPSPRATFANALVRLV